MKKKSMVVVIDMVKGFVDSGNLADPSINRIVPNVVALTRHALIKGDLVVAFKDTHTHDDPEFESFPPHCIKGSVECELIDELKPYEEKMYIIEKPTTNGFNTKKFQEIMEKLDFDEIAICGCCTDICVANFVESLKNYLQETGKNTTINVVANAVDTFNAANHEADKINSTYLRHFTKLQNTIVSNLDIEKCLTGEDYEKAQ